MTVIKPEYIHKASNFRGTTFREGVHVCVALHALPRAMRKEPRMQAKIVNFLGARYPGGVSLDRPLAGFRYWNIDDLVLARNLPATRKQPYI